MSQLIECPECKKHLQVPEDLLGKKVQCPECKHTFVASAPETQTVTAKPSAASSSPAKVPEWEKKSSSDSRSSSPKKRPRDDEYDVEDRDEDDEDGRPRRRRRRSSSSGSYMPHRGGMILAFGLISLLTGMVPLGIIAWIMGNNDMAEIRAGRMDPEGEGMTQAGRIMGMISTILVAVSLVGVFAAWGCCCLGIIGAGAGANNANRRGRF